MYMYGLSVYVAVVVKIQKEDLRLTTLPRKKLDLVALFRLHKLAMVCVPNSIGRDKQRSLRYATYSQSGCMGMSVHVRVMQKVCGWFNSPRKVGAHDPPQEDA